jgi:hypothetical protein
MSRVLALLQASGDVGTCLATSIVALRFLWLRMETRR